jgi:two-component system sensor histidine kinase AtoS
MLGRIDALNQTVKDILTYSKPSPPKLQRVGTTPLITEVVNAAHAAIPAAQIEMGGPPLVLKADPEMTRAVLLNLLLNACQSNTPSAPVEVLTARVDGQGSIRILDRGPGLPSEVREHMFQPFITTRAAGTGLGLAIAKRLTQVQGGTISLDDRPDGGTVATITLPLHPADDPPAA